jgi:hypothetical protein
MMSLRLFHFVESFWVEFLRLRIMLGVMMNCHTGITFNIPFSTATSVPGML